MRNIKIRDLEKFHNIEYEFIAFGVYFNHTTKKFHFAIEYKLDDNEDVEYPFTFFLDKYGLSCPYEYNGCEIVEDGEVKAVAEVVTNSDTKLDLLRILNFSTIVDKQVTYAEYEDYLLLVLAYGEGKVFFDDRYAEVPVVASRMNEYGNDNFEYNKSELKSYEKLAEGVNIEANVADDMKLQYVLLENELLNFVFYDEREYKIVPCEIKDL